MDKLTEFTDEELLKMANCDLSKNKKFKDIYCDVFGLNKKKNKKGDFNIIRNYIYSILEDRKKSNYK